MSDDPWEDDSPAEQDADASDEPDDPFEVIDEPETGNPFDRIDADDRDADPFERIDDGEPDQESDGEPFTAVGEDTAPGEETSPAEADAERGSAGEPSSAEGDADPFAGLGRDERTGDPFDGLSGERVDAGEAGQPDSDMWEDLSRSDVEPETETHGQRRFAEVSKHTYCERCEYFSEPPEIACSHEGTDIIEFTDFETVRVADCPIVAEREELADIERER